MKFDTSKIEGYENMTPEQKVSVLEAFEYEDGKAEIERYKNAASKASSEAAEWKRKHNALLSEDEQKKQANEEELSNLKAQLETLTKEKTISTYKSEFLSIGCADDVSSSMAEALAAGDMNAFFTSQKKFIESHDKALKAELIKSTPVPPAGDGTKSIDYAAKAAEAQSNGQYAEAAYYTRLAQENTATK